MSVLATQHTVLAVRGPGPRRHAVSAILPDAVVGTKYWHQLDNGRIQCDLCPRFCKLLERQRGMCFVRARQNDQVVLTTYGRSSGFCVEDSLKRRSIYPLGHLLGAIQRIR